MKKETRHKICAKMRRARERKRLESPMPDYPIILPELRRKIIIIDYDFGEKRYEMDLYKSDRRDCYKVVANGKVWRYRIGWSNILAGIRKSLPRVLSY